MNPAMVSANNPAGKEEDLEVVLDLFYLKRQDEDEQEDTKKAAIHQEIHAVHRLSGMQGQGPVPDQEYAAGKLMGFFAAALLYRPLVYEGIYASSMV